MNKVTLQELAYEIKRKYNFTPKQIIDIVNSPNPENLIPLNLFSNKKLGIMESLVKFLVENKHMRLNEISNLLNRDNRTVWSVYDKTKKKMKKKIVVKNETFVPIDIFRKRENGPLKNLVCYCKFELVMRNKDIANVLCRDEKVISKVLHWNLNGKYPEKLESNLLNY